MSENVELVQRAIDAFIQRDLDAAVRESDPDVVVDWSRSAGPEAGIYHGYQATRERDLGDWVLTVNDALARGRGGIPVEMKVFQLWQVRDGKIVIVGCLCRRPRPSKPRGWRSRRTLADDLPSRELARPNEPLHPS
jgi:hypothetical protein